MTAQMFLTYLVFVVAAVIGVSAAYLPRQMTFAIIAGLAIWLAYVGLLSALGYVRDPSLRPPGIVWLVGPFLLFVVFVVRSNMGAWVAAAIPLWLILGFESFRIGVELLIHRLREDGLVPKLLTYAGGNVDMFVGLSAPIIAWIATRERPGLRLAMGWNVLGLLSLANVATSSMLTGPLKLISTQVPNVAMGFFPYSFIPGFLAPLAVTLHVLAIRAIATLLRDTRSPASGISTSTS
ncbi:hypothetical protein [Bradyrhizobium erythrophlei]|uniref:Uncharacterized protein n=1 Tax=Bradyrhizobium erythrophlei TaxID=1437360 RepID=A0A1M5MMX6_9BRAD|nr:hypothetical protein [Bradyrhizobium erythrophlei]SHG78133.1 hypothetical protein SAMN05444169_4097 [Bradyrhizobium erythrophlei]